MRITIKSPHNAHEPISPKMLDGFCGHYGYKNLIHSDIEPNFYHFSVMGGPCELRIDHENPKSIFTACENEAKRLERKYSRFLEDSDVSKINRNAGNDFQVDEETAGLLNYAETAFFQSGGLFDITSGALSQLWDFKKRQVPSHNAVKQQLSKVGWQHVEWDGKQIRLPPGMAIDLGGVVKEYAADALAAKARECGAASGYINLAGDIAIIGPKQVKANGNTELAPWAFGICDPDNPKQAKAKIKLLAGGLASSGDYERYFEKNGTRFCHIINPKTGYPCSGVSGVSVHSDNCLTAGTLTTIAMLKGPKEGRSWLSENHLEFVLFERDK